MPNIEELLRQAIAEGKFDNLPGKGKPLQLDKENPHADPAWELAYKILKDAGYSLPWIETIREIEADIESTRLELKLAWQGYLAARDEGTSANYTSAEWQQAQQTFREKMSVLNQRIRNYNLDVPNIRFQRPVLVYGQEVQKITAA
jgi:DnaJ family protein C protein 28